MYAIIEDSGSQIKVSSGDIIRVALRDVPAGTATLTFDKVLLFSAGGDAQAKIGQPYVAGAKVVGDILGQEKTDRVVIRKFARRKNYRRHKGHRQDFLKVKVTAIEG